jgi:hypothetical protein
MIPMLLPLLLSLLPSSMTHAIFQSPIALALVNGQWVPENVVNPGVSTDPMNSVICSVIISAPWLGTYIYYAIYASALIFMAATEGKFIRFVYVSFGMIFVAIPFVHYGCMPPIVASAIPLMSQSNFSVPIAGFLLSLIAAILLG